MSHEASSRSRRGFGKRRRHATKYPEQLQTAFATASERGDCIYDTFIGFGQALGAIKKTQLEWKQMITEFVNSIKPLGSALFCVSKIRKQHP